MSGRSSHGCSDGHIGACALAVIICWLIPNCGHADPIELEATTSVSSSNIDRGETLALMNNETEIQFVKSTQLIDMSVGISRITPIGHDRSAFDDELSISIGAGVETSTRRADLSISYLSFPGSDAPPSIE